MGVSVATEDMVAIKATVTDMVLEDMGVMVVLEDMVIVALEDMVIVALEDMVMVAGELEDMVMATSLKELPMIRSQRSIRNPTDMDTRNRSIIILLNVFAMLIHHTL